MATGDRYQFIMFGTYQGKTIANVYFYKASGGAAIASDLEATFITDVWPDIQAVTNVGYALTFSQTINIDNLADFSSNSYVSSGGSVTGNGLPAHDAWSFRYVRAERTNRHGAKRFVGVSESQQEDGVATSAALTLLNTLAGSLDANLVAVGTTFTPVIFRKYSVPPTVPPTIVNDDFPKSDVIYRGIGTQNTRK